MVNSPKQIEENCNESKDCEWQNYCHYADSKEKALTCPVNLEVKRHRKAMSLLSDMSTFDLKEFLKNLAK